MTASIYNFVIEQGATTVIPIQWLSNNIPTDITGYDIRCQLRQTAFSAAVLDELTIANGRITTNPTNGEFELDFPPEITKLYAFQTAVYDVELESGTGVVTRLIQGTVTLSPEVTK